MYIPNGTIRDFAIIHRVVGNPWPVRRPARFGTKNQKDTAKNQEGKENRKKIEKKRRHRFGHGRVQTRGTPSRWSMVYAIGSKEVLDPFLESKDS